MTENIYEYILFTKYPMYITNQVNSETGYQNGTSVNNAGNNFNVWSSSLNEDNSNNAWKLNSNSGNVNENWNNRYYGQSVRGV